MGVLTPFTGVSLKVGFVVKENGLSIDDVEKLVTWKEEGKFDKIVVVVPKEVDIVAYELASKFGIDVVEVGKDVITERSVTGKYRVVHVHPKVELSQLIKMIEDKLKPGILIKKKKVLSGYLIVYLPLILIRADLVIMTTEEGEVEAEEVKLTFEGVRGYLIVQEGNTMKLMRDLGSFIDLTDKSLQVLELVSKDGYKSISELASELNLSEDRVKSIANLLMARSLVDIYADIVELSKSLFNYSFSPLELVERYGVEIHEGTPESKPGELIVYPRIQVSKLTDFIEALRGKVKEVMVLYYPFCVAEIEERNGSRKVRRFMFIDCVTGDEAWGMSDLAGYVEELLEETMSKVGTLRRDLVGRKLRR